MTLLELLEDCSRRGVELRAAGEDLRVSAPAGAMTAALRESLRLHKAELIGHLTNVRAAPRGTIGPAPADADRSRLSVAQRGLWFLHELDPASLAAYCVRQAIRIEGDLAPARWQAAYEAVVHRHESLRATFERVGVRPAGHVHEALVVPFRHVDLREIPPPQREAELLALMDEDGRHAFDVSRPPLLRATLVRLDEADWCFLICAHHLVADAWSAGLVLREMAAIYDGTPLAPPRLQFADAVHWEADRLGSVYGERDLAYWRKQLADAPVLRLPGDRPAPAAPDYRGASEAIALPDALSRALGDVARRHGVSMFSLMLATCGALLHRYTGAEDVCIGTSVAGREARELEDIVGLFANLIVLRLGLDRDASFAELVARVHREVLDGFAHQQTPFDEVVKAVGPDRALGQNPLFRVLFLFLGSEVERLSCSGLRFDSRQLPSVTSKFDLSFHVEQAPAGWRCLIEYKTSLFRRETIKQMLDGWLALLSAVAGDADVPLSRLPIMAPDGRAELVRRCNEVVSASVVEPTLHGWFARVAREHPDRIALTDGSVQVTYADLDRRSNRLAHALVARGVRLEDRVGLFVDRSCEMIVAILAILKSGGCYVPLDPSDPPARRAALLAACRPPVVVTTTGMAEQLDLPAARLVRLDSAELSSATDAPPTVDVRASNAAYVIHTSGSTGRPRGVVVSHENVTRLMAATEPWFGFDQNDVWTLFHSVAFDFSVWEMWGALLYGGRLVIVPYFTSRAPDQFLDLLAGEGVTVLNQTPSAFRSLIAHARPPRPVSHLRLRTVIFGGEALDPSMLAPWFDEHGDERPKLFNMYGITETTVHVTCRRITKEQGGSSRSLIGERIPDLRLYILDEAMEPVPRGVVGEMYVGGAGPSRGYLGLPGTTAERFMPDPHSIAPGERLYRTGDLACWRDDGDIEYRGRSDHQVKVRGFRIEPGEIEAVLATHPQVRECLVLAREQTPGRRQLVGYYLSDAPADVMATGLRDLCRKLLPPHMVPAAFVQLDTWPLTRNGKLDRDALPAPGDDSRARSAEYDPPRTASELAIARAWQDVLGSKRVGRGDDFFAVGGDSILSLEILGRLRGSGFEASLAMLYQHKRLADLAQALEAAATRADRGAAVQSGAGPAPKPFALLGPVDRARIPDGVVDAYPMSRLQVGILFEEQLSPEDALYRDVFTYHVRLPLDIAVWEAEVAALLVEHDVLRTSLSLTGFEEPLQLVHTSSVLPCTHEDASALTTGEQEERILAVVEEMRRSPYDLDTPPLLRFHLIGRSHDRMQVVLGLHHVILDGWSVATLMTQLLSAYAARCRGRAPPTRQPSPVSFAELIATERAALAAAEHEQFWRQEVELLPTTRLPRVTPAGHGGRRDFQQIPVPIAASVVKGLRDLAAEAGVPLKTVVLAAHLRVLSFLTGESEVATGVVMNGRPEREGAERILGLFLQTLPLRLSLAALHGGPLALVRETFAAECRLLAHRWYPMGAIKPLAGGRDLFEAAFDFVHFHVYEAITKDGGVEVLDHRVWEQTEFPILAQAAVLPTTGALELTLIADATMFPVPQLERMAGYYARCLAGMANRADEPSLLSAEEHALLLERGRNRANETAEEFARSATRDVSATFPQLFAAQAAATPDAVAVAYAGQQLSYRELDQRANQMAHHLRALGVGPEVVVALCLERSPEFLISLIGVLKAGGAYLPLDPGYPLDRLGFMLRDAGTPVLITRTALEGRLPDHGARVVCLDRDWSVIAQQPRTALDLRLDPDNAAYVIYTSGSTGTPKGAVVTHRGMLNHLHAKIFDLGMDRTDVVAQTASQCFDISVWQFLAASVVGGRVLVLPNDVVVEPWRLFEESISGRVTILEVVPSLLQAAYDGAEALAADGSDELVGLRWLLVTGEALPPNLVHAWFQRQPGIPLCNAYGPTECSDDVTHFPIHGVSRLDAVHTPIGRPILNTQAYVLNAGLQLVPDGAIGELYIAGAGVGRGYLGRPGLTAERFVCDPFGPEGSRMYRTGDLARWRVDGVLDFLGRVDTQVKVRGFRIEPEEIAHVLRGAGLREAVVRKQGTGLAAYGVLAEGSSADARSLRAACEAKLPDYMVPAAYVILDALPLTLNGKLDVAALPVPDADALTGGSYVAPRNAIEQRLCAIWEQVLGVERVGVEDRLFELGGNSLHATQLVSRITKVFGVNVPLRVLFEGPTVASLAQRIGELEGQAVVGRDDAATVRGERPRPRRRQRVLLGGDDALVGDS